MTNSLNTVRSPRHFNSVQELTQWLAQDDTNTNPAYATLNGLARAYVLQVKALRAGYLLPANVFWSGSTFYYSNLAVAGGLLCLVDGDTDEIEQGPSFSTPLRPLT